MFGIFGVTKPVLWLAIIAFFVSSGIQKKEPLSLEYNKNGRFFWLFIN
jgi:hypothetical protein